MQKKRTLKKDRDKLEIASRLSKQTEPPFFGNEPAFFESAIGIHSYLANPLEPVCPFFSRRRTSPPYVETPPRKVSRRRQHFWTPPAEVSPSTGKCDKNDSTSWLGMPHTHTHTPIRPDSQLSTETGLSKKLQGHLRSSHGTSQCPGFRDFHKKKGGRFSETSLLFWKCHYCTIRHVESIWAILPFFRTTVKLTWKSVCVWSTSFDPSP